MQHRYLWDFARDESGATAIEYAMLLSLIAMVILGTITSLGISVNGFYTTAGAALAAAG